MGRHRQLGNAVPAPVISTVYRSHGTKGDVLRKVGNAGSIGLATAIGKTVLGMLDVRPPMNAIGSEDESTDVPKVGPSMASSTPHASA